MCCFFPTKIVIRFPKLYIAFVADLSHLQILPLVPTSTWMSRIEVLAWPVLSPTDTTSVFLKPSSDLITYLSKFSEGSSRPTEQRPSCLATSSRHFSLSPADIPHHSRPLTYAKQDGQPAVPQGFSSAGGMQPYEPLTTLSPQCLSLGPPHHLGCHRCHHLLEAFLSPFLQPPEVILRSLSLPLHCCLSPVYTDSALDCRHECASPTPHVCDHFI